jgi:hypothetical protein
MLRSTPLICLVAFAVPAATAAEPVALADEVEVEVEVERLVLGVEVGTAFMGLHGDVTVSIPGAGVTGQPVPLEAAAGLVAGGFVELGITGAIGVRVEGHYARARTTASLPLGAGGGPFGGDGGGSVEYLRSTVEVPILGVWRIPYDGAFVPRLFAGPQLGFTLGGSIGAEASIPDPEMMGNDVMLDASADLGDDTDSLQLGVILGASMTFPLEVGHLVAQVRYHTGVTPAVGEHEVQLMGGAATIIGQKLRDRGLVLLLGYQL